MIGGVHAKVGGWREVEDLGGGGGGGHGGGGIGRVKYLIVGICSFSLHAGDIVT